MKPKQKKKEVMDTLNADLIANILSFLHINEYPSLCLVCKKFSK